MLNKKVGRYNIANGYSWFYPNDKFIKNTWIDKLKFIPAYRPLFKEINRFKH